MTVIKLESFSHDVDIRKGISKFKSFDALRENAFKDGVKSGAEAATRAFETEKLRTLSPILEALNDMAFSQVEARQAILTSLRPLIKQMVEAVLPQCAAQGLAEEISAVVYLACEKAPKSRIVIQVASDAVSAIQEQLASTKADFIVVPGPTLDPLHAKVTWQGGFDDINLASVMAELHRAIDDFFSTSLKTGNQNA
ncbi:MAG: hypothetical protein L3J37_09100 [Rhodobacteraceae bacterium]|nr:hypothetical protein [Paracoccaceae bacterium]